MRESNSMEGFSMLLFCSSLLLTTTISTAIDTINTTQSIGDGETVVSAGGTFELGYFSPGTSKNRYLGIWYKKISVLTVVWVANRESPLYDSRGVLKLTDRGFLVLYDNNDSIIWSSNSSRSAQNPIAQILDSGNLVVKDSRYEPEEDFLWQSFDYPSDTLLPGMKLGMNRITGMDRNMSSWKSLDDPSQGNFTFRVDLGGFPELVLSEGSVVTYRSGPWNGIRFSGTPQLNPNPVYTDQFVFYQKEISYSYELVNSLILSRFVVNPNGIMQRFTWIDQTHSWDLYLTLQIDKCDRYAVCGPDSICNFVRSSVCGCLRGFSPNIPEEWDRVESINGCVRKTPLNCSGDGFLKYSGVKFPDTRKAWFSETMNLKECEMVCRKNCSCTAYANLDIRGEGSGCLLWFDDLIDIRLYSENGQVIYIRMAASELEHGSNVKRRVAMIVGTLLSTGSLALVLHIWKKKNQTAAKMRRNPEEDLELPLFGLANIAYATDNFAISNKLGEGGFGSVYKIKRKACY